MTADRFGGRQALAALMGLGLIGLVACDEGTDGAANASSAPPPEVTVSKPLVRRLTEWDEFTGRFEPVQQVDIRARVSGYVQEIGFEDGAMVQAGQVLFVIDPRPYQAAVDRARAQIETQRAQLELARLDQERTSRLVTTSAAARARPRPAQCRAGRGLGQPRGQRGAASASGAGSRVHSGHRPVRRTRLRPPGRRR